LKSTGLPRRCSRLNSWFRILEQEPKAAAGPCHGGRRGTQAALDSTEDIQRFSCGRLAETPTDDDRLGSMARLFESKRQPERRHSPGFTGAVQSFRQVLSGRGSQGVAPQRPQHTVRVATGVGVSGVGTASRTSDKAGYRIRNRRLCMDSVCVPASPVRRFRLPYADWRRGWKVGVRFGTGLLHRLDGGTNLLLRHPNGETGIWNMRVRVIPAGFQWRDSQIALFPPVSAG